MDAEKPLSARQVAALALIADGGCIAVDQVYGTISASARTQYRTRDGGKLDGRTVGSLLRRGLVELVNPRETGALRIYVLAVVQSQPTGDVGRASVEHYDADDRCRTCRKDIADCGCRLAPVGSVVVEVPAHASAVKIGDRVRMDTGGGAVIVGAAFYVEVHGGTEIEIVLDDVTDDEGSHYAGWWSQVPLSYPVTILVPRPALAVLLAARPAVAA
jgi:hypothetical protein